MKCSKCEQGQVYAALGEHHDMAMDAGNTALEGASMGVEWGWVECECCGGAFEECVNCMNIRIKELEATRGLLISENNDLHDCLKKANDRIARLEKTLKDEFSAYDD